MSRFGAVCAHAAALPLGVMAAIGLAIALAAAGGSDRAIDLHFRDTMFVVAHFHIPALAGGVVLVVSAAVARYGTMNWLVRASWWLLLLHIISAVLLWPPRVGDTPGPGGFSHITFLQPELGFMYIGSALASVGATLLGLAVSLWNSLVHRTAAVS